MSNFIVIISEKKNRTSSCTPPGVGAPVILKIYPSTFIGDDRFGGFGPHLCEFCTILEKQCELITNTNGSKTLKV